MAALIRVWAAVVMTAPALAHHSPTMFDRTKTITLDGIVREFQVTNPHSRLLVDVIGPDGTVRMWTFEAEGRSSLMLMDVTAGAFRSGMRVTVSGHPMKDGRPTAWWVKAVKADGREFFPRGRAAAETINTGNSR